MTGSGRFAVWEGYAVYRGAVGDGSAHRHGAFQVVVGAGREVVVADADGVRHRGAAVVVPPMVWHRLERAPMVVTYFVDPHCAFADRLRARCAGGGVTVAPELRGLDEAELRPAGAVASAGLDPRLRAALELLTERLAEYPDGRLPAAELAARVGLSPQRLRALAQAQLGIPLTRWRSWRRLALAVGALDEGRTPAEAALAGGFADQAHLGRWMREMLGLTPSVVSAALRAVAEDGRRSAAVGDVDRDGAGER
ncbi:AraC family transcriptional regulator [Kitasatospora sp. NPDC093806]|uniref:helix-turn-helix domain-containing protein n=1 Tax=Kitasatospora sp. NPDC093806 TaxID=3155075 RepID=UPI003445A7E3